MKTFQFECGEHKGIVEATTLGKAWRKLTKKAAVGFSPLARVRESLPATAGRKHRAGWQPWQYITPLALDKHP